MSQGLKIEHVGGRQKLVVSLVLAAVVLLVLWQLPLLIPAGVVAVSLYDITGKAHLRLGRWFLFGMASIVILGGAGMVRMLQLDNGRWLFLGLLAVVASTDVFAQVVGRLYGTPGTFMPHCSPNKSSAGVYGSWVVGGTVAVLVAGVHSLCLPAAPFYYAMLVVAPMVSTYGDVYESATKRALGIKDFGSYLGASTGALLDRVDSWVAVFAVAYVGLVVLQ